MRNKIQINYLSAMKLFINLMFICLKCVSGCLHVPPRLRNELIWNSTANLVGKPGHNIALDLVNEFLNNEYKCKYL